MIFEMTGLERQTGITRCDWVSFCSIIVAGLASAFILKAHKSKDRIKLIAVKLSDETQAPYDMKVMAKLLKNDYK
jgi:hypothetical protein